MISRFSDLALLSDDHLRTLLKKIDNVTLLLALCNEERIVRPRVSQVLGERARQIFYEDLRWATLNPPESRFKCEAQNKIIEIANILLGTERVYYSKGTRKAS